MVGLIVLGALVLARSPEAQPTAPKSRPAASSPAAASTDGKNAPVTVNSDTLESLQKEGLAVFKGNVVARQDNSIQYADRMEVYTDAKTKSIERVVSTGNVRIITRDCRMGTANRAEYYDVEQRVVLIGNARVWQEDNVVSGDTITIYISQDRAIAQSSKGERVKTVIYPRDDNAGAAGATARAAPATACVN